MQKKGLLCTMFQNVGTLLLKVLCTMFVEGRSTIEVAAHNLEESREEPLLWGHNYSRDTSIQGTQNLVPGKTLTCYLY